MLFSEKNTKDVRTKAEERVVKIEKEYCKENCIDRSVIEPIIIDLCDDDSDDDAGYLSHRYLTDGP